MGTSQRSHRGQYRCRVLTLANRCWMPHTRMRRKLVTQDALRLDRSNSDERFSNRNDGHVCFGDLAVCHTTSRSEMFVIQP